MSRNKPTMGKIVDSPYEYKPTITVTSNQVPEIKDWKVGKKYDLTLEVRMKSIRINEDKTHECTFEVISGDSEKKETETDED